MRTPRFRALTAVLTLAASSLVAFAFASPATAAVPGQVVITEWMYNPNPGPLAGGAATGPGISEFVEVTNIGGEPVDMTGYSFDDASQAVNQFSLTALGTLAPGESGLIVEATAAAFRTEWGLSATVKVAGGNGQNLGRGDEMNVYKPDGTLADRLTYNDQTILGSFRTQGVSGAPVSCLALGANNAALWVPATVGDANGSHVSLHGDLGSPGFSPRGACGPVTIVGGGPTNTAPCTPESASSTGPLAAGAQPWPGDATVTVTDNTCAWKTSTGPEGRDMSGLVFDPANSGVLYAVKNKSWVFRLVKLNGVWVSDTTNDWGAGKQISAPGIVLPDSEGLTVGADGALYVTTERDNNNNSVALNAILRFDPDTPGTTLTATHVWNLTLDFPELNPPNLNKANLGFEGVAFVPDSYLVENGFFDQSKMSTYNPGDYPEHGDGLFFAALENDGKLYAYALGTDDGSHSRIAEVDTLMGHVMDVQYDADLQRIWALCDNTCSVSSTVLKVDDTGTIVPDVVYAGPAHATAGLPIVNIEGFAIAPAATCVDGVRETVWSDDGISAPGHEGHALYSGTFPCDIQLGEQGAPPAVDLGPLGPDEVSVPKKGTLAVRGSGFEPGEIVRIELHDKQKVDVLATVVADDFGFAIVDVDIPAGVQPGVQEIWLVAPSTTATGEVTVTTPAAK